MPKLKLSNATFWVIFKHYANETFMRAMIDRFRDNVVNCSEQYSVPKFDFFFLIDRLHDSAFFDDWSLSFICFIYHCLINFSIKLKMDLSKFLILCFLTIPGVPTSFRQEFHGGRI